MMQKTYGISFNNTASDNIKTHAQGYLETLRDYLIEFTEATIKVT
jgi:hypothetical protein